MITHESGLILPAHVEPAPLPVRDKRVLPFLDKGQQVDGFEIADVLAFRDGSQLFTATRVADNIDTGGVVVIKALCEYDDAAIDRGEFELGAHQLLPDSPGLVATHGVGRFLDNFGASRRFVAEEHGTGGDLNSRIRDGSCNLKVAIEAGLGALEGIDSLAKAGIRHNDIKPHNLVLFQPEGASKESGEGVWKLIDLGIASADFEIVPATVSEQNQEMIVVPGKHVPRGTYSSTSGSPQIFGTLGHAAPEVIFEGIEASSAKSAIFELSTTLFRASTRHLPFAADNYLGALIDSHAVPDPRDINPLLNRAPGFAEVVRDGLQRDPDMRPEPEDYERRLREAHRSVPEWLALLPLSKWRIEPIKHGRKPVIKLTPTKPSPEATTLPVALPIAA
jgi:serine/threonine protein kinase